MAQNVQYIEQIYCENVLYIEHFYLSLHPEIE